MAPDKKRKRLQVDAILPSKRSKLTQSTKNYTYQSFSNRIASLKIDPVRRGHANDDLAQDFASVASFFRTSLDNWTELNLSDNFTVFVRTVSPLSDSLAQLIHHSNEIFDLLLSHIEQGNPLSLQPLLDLVAQFAHDLGSRFEQYFSRALDTVTKLAASHADVQVIEWSFNCLAWLFKYLSKLLVPDLRPLFDVIAPLLGKSRQKQFVSRFAAEAVSFLIRRASVSYHTNPTWLKHITWHIMNDVQTSSQITSLEQYELGIVSLLSEAIKGPKNTLQSNGIHIFQELLDSGLELACQDSALSPAYQVLQGVLTSLLHATSADALQPILRSILGNARVNGREQLESNAQAHTRLQLLLQIVYFRSSEHINDWDAIFNWIATSFSLPDLSKSLTLELAGALALCHNLCSVDVSTRNTKLLEWLSEDERQDYFLPFCDIYSRYRNGRFRGFLQQHFQKFVNSHWHKYQDELLDLIPRLRSRVSGPGNFDIPEAWKTSLRTGLQNSAQELSRSPFAIFRLYATIETVAAIADQEFSRTYLIELWELTLRDVIHVAATAKETLLLIFGRLLGLILSTDASIVDIPRTWTLLSTHVFKLWEYPTFWQSAISILELAMDDDDPELKPDMLQAIELALQSASHEVRLHTLVVLQLLHRRSAREELDCFTLALDIERTEPSLENFRLIGMNIRKLGAIYTAQSANVWSRSTIPSYCLGLLRAKFAPMWESAVTAIQSICETVNGAEVVGDIAPRWLEHSAVDVDMHTPAVMTDTNQAPPDLDQFNDWMAGCLQPPQDVTEHMRQEFELSHKRAPSATSRDRGQILLLFNSIPKVAERRSRLLVPILLQWVRAYQIKENATNDENEVQTASKSWSRQDLKALLAVFAKFANPRSMYQANQVYQATFSLLSHGDIDIQRHSLKVIFAWKHPAVNKYRDNLLNLLDDDKIKDQFAGFLVIGAGDDSLQEEHRADTMPIIIRLLFGRIVSRSKGDKQRAIRRAVFDMVSRFGSDEANGFLDVAVGELAAIDLLQSPADIYSIETPALIFPRQQIGMLNLLNEYLAFLGATTSVYAERLINPVLYCLLRAAPQDGSSAEDHLTGVPSKSMNKSIRTAASQCLLQLFEICSEHDWSPFVALIWAKLVEPRLSTLQQETTQGVSWMFRMFAAWAQAPQHVGFLTLSQGVLLHRLADCVGSSTTKEEVKHFVVSKIFLSALHNLKDAEVTEDIFSRVLSCSPSLLRNLELALASDCSKDMLSDTVKLISHLSELTTVSSFELIRTSCALVRQPSQKVSVVCKQTLLTIIKDALFAQDIPQSQVQDVFDLLCSSYSRGIAREARVLLGAIAVQLAQHDSSITTAVNLVTELNSHSTTRLDEPDYARREIAFGRVSSIDSHFSSREWALLLSNCMFFITDVDELSIRTSASFCVRRFIQVTAESPEDEKNEYMRILQDIVFANVEKGISDKPETVRVEYMSILAEIVKMLPDWHRTRDLANVVWSNDEEASFFVNILHIQQHRRVRALVRLQDEVVKGTLSSRNIAHLFIPLLEQFIFNDNKAGEVAGESSKAIGRLAEWIEYPQFRSLLRRHVSYLQHKPDMQEPVLKLLDNVAAAFGNAHHAKMSTTSTSALSRTLPKEEALTATILRDFLPSLSRFLQEKDESFVSRRVAAVVVTARILQALPEREFAMKFPPILTDTCNIMRSRDQNSRDMTRKALISVCTIVGPGAFGFVVKELRRALQRGFFLHVLGYTVHALLESVIDQYKPGDLDQRVSDVMDVVMDDVFGVTGQEKEAAEFLRDSQSKKEVKSRKSFDTIQLLAKVTSTQYLIEIVRPIKNLLLERLPQKMMVHVDELLRRIEVGIAQRTDIANTDVLTFCFQIYQDAFEDPEAATETAQAMRGIDAPMPDRWKERKKASTSSQKEKLGKISRFSLDLVRSVLRKNKELKTPSNVAGFLPIIKDALLQDNEETKLAALRLFAALTVVPLKQIDADIPVYLSEAVKIIESSQSSKDELSQGALKLVATILRERKSVKVANATIVTLLQKIRPDLQIISQQGAAFNLIRSVMSRKIVVPEIYDLMDGDDGVAAISVRDHDRTTRDLARGVYVQFVIDYPQAQKRFDKQLKFLVRNLEYDYPEGRMSVMDALNTLHLKMGDKLVQDVVKQTFWPVVSLMTNDDIADCRIMAQGLLRTILSRAGDAWLDTFLATVQKLLLAENHISRQTALQCWTLYLEVKTEHAREAASVIKAIRQILGASYDDVSEVWQLRFYALSSFHEICKAIPSTAFASTMSDTWGTVYAQLAFPHAWVKHEAAKAIGMLMTTISTAQSSLAVLPLRTTHGVYVDQKGLVDLTRRHTLAIREGITQDFASQLVRNLLFLGRCFSESRLEWSVNLANIQQESHESDDSDESRDGEEQTTNNLAHSGKQSALKYLISRAALLLRRESQKRVVSDALASRRAASLIPRASALQLLAALVTTLPVEDIQPSVSTILVPLVHLTDVNITAPTSSDTDFAAAYNALVTNATELLDILQNKLGTTEFVAQLGQVKRAIGEKRDERRIKRRVEVIRDPRVVEKRKVQKREKEKVRRKEKSEMHRGRRRGW